MKKIAEVVDFVAYGDAPTHEVVIFDKVAQALADRYLPPVWARVSAKDLQAAVDRLVEATNAVKRMERES
jgi:hypothetical protein